MRFAESAYNHEQADAHTCEVLLVDLRVEIPIYAARGEWANPRLAHERPPCDKTTPLLLRFDFNWPVAWVVS